MTTSAVACFHCHEVVPVGSHFMVEFDGAAKSCCCPGCQAVADTIIKQGLSDYYRFRTKPASKADAIPAELQQLQSYDHPEILSELAVLQGEFQRIELSISGMSCAACAWLIEKNFQHDTAVKRLQVNSATSRCELIWDANIRPLSEILKTIHTLGYQANPFVADAEEQHFKQEMQDYLKRLAISGIMTMQVMMLAFGLYFGEHTGIELQYEGYLRWVSLLLTLPVMAYSALPFTRSAYRALRQRELNMDVPITLAIYYTFIASFYATVSDTGDVYFESVCMFVFLLQVGKFFEFRARKQARDATSNLLKIMPVSAELWRDGRSETVAARKLQINDVILVKAGETIPADGVIVTGQSSVDESMLTGEYQPVKKQPDDFVLAGSNNHDGILTVRVIKALTESRLGQIIQLQQQTLHQKPALLEKTDKIARFFVQRLLVVATATFLVWYFYLDESRAFWVTLSVLVATCPCALSLATPTAITCALAWLNKQGVLIKNQQVLASLPKLTKVFFDKTGTLTQGKFSIEKVVVHDLEYTESELLQLAAHLELRSEHPIAKAFLPYLANNRADDLDCPVKLQDVELVVGRGLQAKWWHNDSWKQVKIGSASFCQVSQAAQVCLTVNDVLAASVTLVDAIRPEIQTLIARLHENGIKMAIITGDSSSNAELVATQLNIAELHRGCSPEEKVAQINLATQAGETVLMVGDGINDSPCFHAAHVSVALDSGTDLSKNQADVVLLHNNLTLLYRLIEGAQRARRVVRQNLIWAFGYNLVIIPLAVCGFVSPYVAVIGMSTSSLLVVSNSLRLLKA